MGKDERRRRRQQRRLETGKTGGQLGGSTPPINVPPLPDPEAMLKKQSRYSGVKKK